MSWQGIPAHGIEAIALVPSISSPVSLVCSTMVVFMIYRRRMWSPYYRLLLGLSITDIVTSSWFMLGPMPVDAEWTGQFGARGNQQTCSALGFVTQIAVGRVFYHSSLMLYFLLKICYGYTEAAFSHYLERFSHLFCIIVPILFGSIGVAEGIFNPAGIGLLRCYIVPYPPGCNFQEDVECTRGQSAPTFLWLFMLVPVGVCYIFLNYAILRVYCMVRSRIRISRQQFGHNCPSGTLRAVERQSILYALVFFFQYLWVYILVFTEATTKDPALVLKMWPIQVLMEIFFPLQGFFTMLIFVHPRFCSLTAIRGDKSLRWVLWGTFISKDKIDDLRRLSRRSTLTIQNLPDLRGLAISSVEESKNEANPDPATIASPAKLPTAPNNAHIFRPQKVVDSSHQEGSCSSASHDSRRSQNSRRSGRHSIRFCDGSDLEQLIFWSTDVEDLQDLEDLPSMDSPQPTAIEEFGEEDGHPINDTATSDTYVIGSVGSGELELTPPGNDPNSSFD